MRVSAVVVGVALLGLFVGIGCGSDGAADGAGDPSFSGTDTGGGWTCVPDTTPTPKSVGILSTSDGTGDGTGGGSTGGGTSDGTGSGGTSGGTTDGTGAGGSGGSGGSGGTSTTPPSCPPGTHAVQTGDGSGTGGAGGSGSGSGSGSGAGGTGGTGGTGDSSGSGGSLPAMPKLCKPGGVNNEPDILVGYAPADGQTVNQNGQIKVWVNDEGAPIIAPNEQVDPNTGAITQPGDRTAKASDGYLWEPALYIAPQTAESGGTPHFPTAIKGSYNNQPSTKTSGHLVQGMDPPPPGSTLAEKYTGEDIWDVSSLGLAPGTYIAEFVIHDGDHDRAIGCVTIVIK